MFSWKLKPSEQDFTDLWKSAIFVFDTNFLLDLYRVSYSTAKDFLNILEHLEGRIWLPYQVASEFLNRREEIIDSEAKSFQKALEALEKWKNEQLSFGYLKGLISQAGRIVSSEVAFLFEQQDDYKKVVEKVEKSFKDKIGELAETHPQLNFENDYILEKLLTLFDGKIGEPFNSETLQKLYKEGEERYKQEKPPGFKDATEKEDERKYGDFILWKQILDFAKSKSCSIVLITGEKKEDWWIKKGGEIVSPHFELRREFKEQVNQLFWMYKTQRFLEIAREKLEIEISPRSIEEANVVAEAEAAEEKSYEEISQVLQQIQTPRISVDLLNEASVRANWLNEAARANWLNEVARVNWLNEVARVNWLNEVARPKWLNEAEVARAKWLNEAEAARAKWLNEAEAARAKWLNEAEAARANLLNEAARANLLNEAARPKWLNEAARANLLKAVSPPGISADIKTLGISATNPSAAD